ncbi:GNAT family N-acetyltransferase [Shimazuella sp. AN120528]|uniref:GNAT family N-acetyltransferase n=1 Tax=Shimazuella soli TaxID=1892854 RepID=UPI001F1186B5|nr:GNAT family N-acetyltransferase [Shimazuella soli]MCH5584603.1 GNAT family N-acetyltransferase [Shimazuella soli]
MISFRKLSDCTWNEMTTIWNKGFEGYFVPLHFNEAQLNIHLVKGDISPKHSFIAFYNNEPAGFVLNGFRQVGDKKVAWNGGTGVAKEFRGFGIGKAMMQKCMAIYKDEQVDIATLEAIERNEPAIRLYEKFGYSITNQLYFYDTKKVPTSLPVRKTDYRLERISSKAVKKLPFWNKWTPWQNQITNQPDDSQAIIVSDINGNPIGYAHIRDIFDSNGEKIQTILCHCEIKPGFNKKETLEQLLLEVFAFERVSLNKNPFTFSTYNLLLDDCVKEVLESWNFEKKMGQVWMQQTFH